MLTNTCLSLRHLPHMLPHMYHASDARVPTHTHDGCSGYGGNGGYGKGRAAGVHRSETAMWQGSWFVGVLGPTSGAFHLCVKCRSSGCCLPCLAHVAPLRCFLCVLPSVARMRQACLASCVSASAPSTLAHAHTAGTCAYGLLVCARLCCRVPLFPPILLSLPCLRLACPLAALPHSVRVRVRDVSRLPTLHHPTRACLRLKAR